MMIVDRFWKDVLGHRRAVQTLYILTTLSCLTSLVYAAWHDQLNGSGVAAHYVRLSGHAGDNKVKLQNLIEMREACVRVNRDMGRPVQTFDVNSYPALVTVIDLEIYYSANRTLDVFQSLHHSIDLSSCALEVTAAKKLTLRSGAGKCDVDLVKKTAIGNCDAQAHATALAWQGNTTQLATSVDMDKVPSQFREQVIASLKQMQNANSHESQSKELVQPLKQGKRLIDVDCQVYKHSQLNHEVCIAQPNATSKPGINPYPIPASPLSAGISGILLESKSPALSISAQQVDWNLSVSPDVFKIPTGIQLPTQSRTKP